MAKDRIDRLIPSASKMNSYWLIYHSQSDGKTLTLRYTFLSLSPRLGRSHVLSSRHIARSLISVAMSSYITPLIQPALSLRYRYFSRRFSHLIRGKDRRRLIFHAASLLPVSCSSSIGIHRQKFFVSTHATSVRDRRNLPLETSAGYVFSVW